MKQHEATVFVPDSWISDDCDADSSCQEALSDLAELLVAKTTLSDQIDVFDINEEIKEALTEDIAVILEPDVLDQLWKAFATRLWSNPDFNETEEILISFVRDKNESSASMLFKGIAK